MSQLTPEDAYNVLVSEVHAPVFFNKLASVYGIRPNNQEEARELILMAGQLRNAHEQEKVKKAAATTNSLALARNDLTSTLTQQGYAALVDDDVTVKQAAATAVSQSALIKEAAVVFGNYLQNSSN